MRPDRPTAEFRALLEAAPDALIIIDRGGAIVQVNAQAERLFGFPRAELIGQAVEALIPERFHDRHPGHRNAYFTEPRIRPMGHLGVELFGRRRDGSEFPAEVSLSPLTLDGEQYVIAAIRDGTVRRAVEARFRRLLEAAPDAMVIVGPDGAIAHVNAQAVALFGHARDELLGRPVEMLIPARYREAHPAHRRGYFAEPRTRPMGGGGLQLFGLRKDGTEFPAEISLSPLTTEDGVLAITAIRDITDRQRAEEERRRLAQAEEAVKMRDEFISIASHELKTPLTALQMQVDTILRSAERLAPDAFRARAAAKLPLLRAATQRISNLTDQLLDISRITGGRLALERQPVDLAAIVRDVAAHFEDDLARAGCPLTLDLADEAPLAGDPLRLEQVVTNLLSNAVKYGAGKPIEVWLRGEGGEGGEVRLRVRDHGIGIAPEHLSRVFEKFERAVSHRQYGGFGLGLWIARQLIEAHGGRILVESRPGAGSTFTVVLPERPRDADAAPARGGPAVLIVDDDPDIRDTFSEALLDEGIDARTAADGRQALEVLRGGPPPRVILLDLMMPGMDGPTFRSEQQRDPALAAIPTIVMSAAADGELQARRLGCEFLRKPLTLERLLGLVRAHERT